MNVTRSGRSLNYTVEDYYISAGISSSLALISIIINIITLILIWRKKPYLHTINHLLICNTSIASILYCIVTINNYIYLIFIKWDTSDISCRWRAYFLFAGIAGVLYSYMIQAISRAFFSILSINYRWLTTFKTNNILITIQWFVVFILVSPTVITDNVHFDSSSLCWISSEYTLHVQYAFVVYYILPAIIITIIYICIFYRVKRIKRNAITMINIYNSQKHDLELLRNIVILIIIFLGGGLPSIFSNIFPSKILYLLSLITQPLTVCLATLCSIVLDRKLRQVVKKRICRRRRVVPKNNNIHLIGRIQHKLP